MNQREQTLLVGNGINRISNTYSWDNLMNDLVKFIEKGNIISEKDKAFPLFYEELVLRGKKYSEKKEEEILDQITNQTEKLKRNNIHKLIRDSSIDNILTTNYDFLLHSKTNKKNFKFDTSKKGIETTYNFFTYFNMGNKKIWHIHGRENNINSIVLGHRKYSKNIAKIVGILKDENELKLSWLNFIFEHDIHILGLNLDSVEIDLWLLLNERARNMHKYKNKIFYYNLGEIDKSKRELLEAHEVEIVIHPKIQNNHKNKEKKIIDLEYENFYEHILTKKLI